MIAFFVSDDAAYVSGQVLCVNRSEMSRYCTLVSADPMARPPFSPITIV